MKINKPKFKRGKGGDGGWGVGLDYLLKPYWNNLDILIENNYYGRHDKKLINHLLEIVKIALNNSILEMKKLCKKGLGLNDWIKKAKKVENLGKFAEKETEKVIFIDAVTQFLRETTTGPRKKIFKREIIKNLKIERNLIGKVTCAFVKKINGRARIIAKNRDFNQFKSGEILITQETDASFLQIMKKAKAFITDEGGVLCHAAIVARELKKPCIVGAKNATKILKNGDLIEMNLKNGEIKTLS